ncbi:unnamed protein product [Nesidiocoris tenuis]|uniref:Uncharacterized protein n=1 Tax=Nesidiocoris tenuis TaxID=355587 RepID=A0A6H5GCK7_9HEMI|nr:unnamed protein product [Nesidiocoris tenuis]
MDSSMHTTSTLSSSTVEDTAQTQEGSGGGYSSNSLRRRKIKLRKRTAVRKSESGSEGLLVQSDSSHPTTIGSSPVKVPFLKSSARRLSGDKVADSPHRRYVPPVESPSSSGSTSSDAESDVSVKMRRKICAMPSFRIGPAHTLSSYAMDRKPVPPVSNDSSYSEQAWDNYQEKYMSEPYSEEPPDSEAARRLLEFGDDYRNFLDSQSDCASSSLGRNTFHRRPRKMQHVRSDLPNNNSTLISCSVMQLKNTNSFVTFSRYETQKNESFHLTPGRSSNFVSILCGRELHSSGEDEGQFAEQQTGLTMIQIGRFGLRPVEKFPFPLLAPGGRCTATLDNTELQMELLYFYPESIPEQVPVCGNLQNHGSHQTSQNQNPLIQNLWTQCLIERWEGLEKKSEDLQKVRFFAREISALKEQLLEIGDRVARLDVKVEDRDQLELRIEDVQREVGRLKSLKPSLLQVNVAVHRFLTETGNAEAPNTLKDEVADLYSTFDETCSKVFSVEENLKDVTKAWQQFESYLATLQIALRSDSENLRKLDEALSREEGTGNGCKVSTHIATSVKDLAILLSEKEQANKLNDSQSIYEMMTGGGNYSDSGISDSGSEVDLSEREKRLAALRRLVRHLEAVLAPGSAAIVNMSKASTHKSPILPPSAVTTTGTTAAINTTTTPATLVRSAGAAERHTAAVRKRQEEMEGASSSRMMAIRGSHFKRKAVRERQVPTRMRTRSSSFHFRRDEPWSWQQNKSLAVASCPCWPAVPACRHSNPLHSLSPRAPVLRHHEQFRLRGAPAAIREGTTPRLRRHIIRGQLKLEIGTCDSEKKIYKWFFAEPLIRISIIGHYNTFTYYIKKRLTRWQADILGRVFPERVRNLFSFSSRKCHWKNVCFSDGTFLAALQVAPC